MAREINDFEPSAGAETFASFGREKSQICTCLHPKIQSIPPYHRQLKLSNIHLNLHKCLCSPALWSSTRRSHFWSRWIWRAHCLLFKVAIEKERQSIKLSWLGVTNRSEKVKKKKCRPTLCRNTFRYTLRCRRRCCEAGFRRFCTPFRQTCTCWRQGSWSRGTRSV